MLDLRELGDIQLDGLREVANMGAGHAATALSKLTAKRIMITVPEIQVLPADELPDLVEPPGTLVAGVKVQLLGDLAGTTMQVYPSVTAVRLAGILLGREGITFPDDFGELEASALKEVGNIIGGAYLNALADFLGMLILTSVPSLDVGAVDRVLMEGLGRPADLPGHLFCAETVLLIGDDQDPARGHILLAPDLASLEAILRAIRLG